MQELIVRVKKLEDFLKDETNKARIKSLDYLHYPVHRFVHTDAWVKVETYEKCLETLYEFFPELREVKK